MAKKIIVIDDEKIVCDMAKKILQAEGYEVEAFTDSQLALEAIRSQAFDLVITDLKMENVSGMDILKEVNRLYPQHPGHYAHGLRHPGCHHRGHPGAHLRLFPEAGQDRGIKALGQKSFG